MGRGTGNTEMETLKEDLIQGPISRRILDDYLNLTNYVIYVCYLYTCLIFDHSY